MQTLLPQLSRASISLRWRAGRCSLVLAALVVALWGAALPAGAQAPISLASLEIQLWPEYDKPSTLVIIEGKLDSSVALPARLALPIPAAAGAPNAVATVDVAGRLLTAPFTTTVAGSVIMVEFETDTAGFWMEYYDPALDVSGEARQYTFEWQSDYAVAAARLRVQQPYQSRDLTLEPALNALGPGSDGLNYFEGSLGALKPAQAVTLRLAYAKSGSGLSIDAPGVRAAPAASAPAGTPASTGASLSWAGQTPALLAGAGVLAAVLIGMGGYWWYRQARPARRPSRSGRGRRGRSRSAAREAGVPAPTQRREPRPAPGSRRFCTQCGAALQAGDRFCRSCGAAAPTERVREESREA